ncbi:membrane dipeptidase [Solirubrobacter soli]|uniref:membrane dipeptidase n=1 Tax=Solirubrobacter soli TaxID=363832 RepID=UPI000402B2A3|nr:membrane dipeptidase [Solirubrobacter soli]
MIDLHIHFPMRLLEEVEAPRDVIKGMAKVRDREGGKIRAAVFAIAARLLNFRNWDGSWRVTPDLLRQGDVSIACSVLYRPFSEMDLGEPYAAPPESAYFAKLIELLEATEREVARTGGVIVRTAADLEKSQTRYVHCVEGGFHLGATPEEVTRNVNDLADRGVMYITLAHLFWRRVATNAPALPFLPERVYNVIFPQEKGAALSELGEAAVRAMYERKVLVDISHMREDAIKETFELVEQLDKETGRDPHEYPVIASHAGYRFGGQQYNVSDHTIVKVTGRGGVIGLIFAQHQMNDGLRRTETKTLVESVAVLARHIDAIGPQHVALGSDLDGFIKPTLGGIENAGDLAALAAALRNRYPTDADAILEGNARRVIETRFATP